MSMLINAEQHNFVSKHLKKKKEKKESNIYYFPLQLIFRTLLIN